MTVLINSGSICLVAIVMATTAVAQSEDPKPTELSVAPLDQVDYPSDRPTWLEDGPNFDNKIHSWIVVTNPCDSVKDCDDEIKLLQRAAVASYIRHITESIEVDFYPINDEWIESRLVVDRYSGSVSQSGTEMYEQAVKLEFTPGTQKEIKEAWQQIQVRDRLGALGVLVFLGLTGLICCSTVLSMISRRVEKNAA